MSTIIGLDLGKYNSAACTFFMRDEAKLDVIATSDPAKLIRRSAPALAHARPRSWPPKSIALSASRARQVSAYAGLVPRQYLSGHTKRFGHITRRGPRLLRKMLVEAAWAMLRYNDWTKRTFMRPTKGKRTRTKQALVALARKLLVGLWGHDARRRAVERARDDRLTITRSAAEILGDKDHGVSRVEEGFLRVSS